MEVWTRRETELEAIDEVSVTRFDLICLEQLIDTGFFAGFLASLSKSGSSGAFPVSGNGLNPFTDRYMHNSMYRDNTYHHQLSIPGTSFQNERSSRQVQQAFKKQRNRNVRRGRRLSRRGKCYQI